MLQTGFINLVVAYFSQNKFAYHRDID